MQNTKHIIALVGMPGAGKSEAASYLVKQGIPFIRFGQFTEEAAHTMGLPVTAETEQIIREKLRVEHGMAAYAIKASSPIKKLLETNMLVAIDGLYSWEEYLYLKEKFPQILLVHIFASPKKRYERLQKRSVRPFKKEEARTRDIAEIEKLNKGGPIALADYLIYNDTDVLDSLHVQLQQLIEELSI